MANTDLRFYRGNCNGENVTIRVEKNVYPAAVSILGSEVTFKHTEMDILCI